MNGFGSSPGFQDKGMNQVVSGFSQSTTSPKGAPAPSSGSAFNPLSFAPGILGTVGNWLYSDWQQNKQNKYNQEQQDKMNSYNSPTAIKNRLLAAGVPEKAALNAIAGSPSLGEQTTLSPSASPMPTSPGTDFMSGINSGFANQLVDAQTQNTQAQAHATLTDTSLKIKESSYNVQKTLAETKYINEQTLTNQLLRMLRTQEQPYRVKLMEAQYVQANLVVGAWNTLTESEKRQTLKSLGKTVYNNASYDSQMARYKSKNAFLENQVMVAALKAAITKNNYENDEYKQKGRVLLAVYDAIEAGAKRDAVAYGWDQEQLENQRENKGIIFNTYELDLSNQYDASVVLNRRLRFLNDHPWLIDAQAATAFGGQAFNTAVKVGSNFVPYGKAAKLLHF